MFHMLSAFAEFETNIRKERQTDGIMQAQKKGIRFGRPRAISDETIRQIKIDRTSGLSVINIAKKYTIDRSYVYRLLNK